EPRVVEQAYELDRLPRRPQRLGEVARPELEVGQPGEDAPADRLVAGRLDPAEGRVEERPRLVEPVVRRVDDREFDRRPGVRRRGEVVEASLELQGARPDLPRKRQA